MFIVYPEVGVPKLFLTKDSARSFSEATDGAMFKLRYLKDEEQANVVAFASVSDKNEVALFLDYSKTFSYAYRRGGVVKNLVLDIV